MTTSLQSSSEDADPPPNAAKVDLSSTSRCGCRFSLGDDYGQPDGCRLASKPDVIGLKGYVRTSVAPIDLLDAPWSTKEYKQTGPNKYDPVHSLRKARSMVRIVDVHFRDSPADDLQHSLVRIEDLEGLKPRTSWIDMSDFDTIPWWKCSPDKAVGYSPLIVRPDPASRPLDQEGRWIDSSVPKKVWCWTYVENVGMYCDPHLSGRGDMSSTWIFKPSELEILY